MIPSEMTRQLEILGYTSPKSRVRVRCFVAKGMPLDEQLKQGTAWRKDKKTIIPIPIEGWLYPNGAFVRLRKKRCGDKVELDSNGNPIWIEAKSYRDGIAYLRSLNTSGYGVYLIPNEGGGADADINRFPSLFYECDAVTKDEQWQRLRSLEAALGHSASLVIETRSSLHCYFALTFDNLLPYTWTQNQQRLIQRQDSDPAICNPARLMRLAGFDHQKWNSETNTLEQFPVRLVQESDRKFALDEFERVLPQWNSDRWSRHQTNDRVKTSPTDNPWDIRNFAHCLDGYQIDGRQGWDTGKCPAHNGQSDNSLHIEQSTGAYKCHANCDPKDIYHAALELARSRGYQLPEKPRTGHKFSDLGGGLFKLKQRLVKSAKPKGWGVGRKGEVEVKQPSVKVQPAFVYKNEGQNRERLDTWAESLKVHKYLLDSSAMGTGKSYDAGLTSPELFDARQVICVSSEHRNPTTPTLKGWADLQARHKGLTRDEFGKLRRAKPGQPYVISPNCGRNDTISVLRTKNIGGADTSGLICKTCPNLEPCQAGAVYGYLHDRAQSLRQPRLRAHPQSLPSPTEYDYSNDVLLWDEASQILKSHRSINVSATNVTQAIADLAIASPKLFDALRPLLTALHPYLSGEIKPPYYGWKHEFIKEVLPPVDADIDALRSLLEADFDKLLNSTKEHGVDLADLPRGVRKRFSDSDSNLSEQVSKISLNWLPDFLEVLHGNVAGNLRIGYSTLTITVPDRRLAEIAKAAKGNIFLDATANPKDLALVLGCEPSEILTVRQEIPDTSNLEIIQIATMGRLGTGSERSEFCKLRVDAIINQIRVDTSGDVAVIDFKRHTADGDGKRHWWVDSRGSNDLIGCKALALVGVPCPNLGELQAEFSVLHERSPQEGTKKVKYPVQVNGQPSKDLEPFFEMEVSINDEFNEFCRRRVLADINQAIGRLRAHLRADEFLKVYFIADYPLDIPVTLRRAADVTPEAATKVEKIEMAIKGAVKQLRDAGQKITQDAIALLAGVSQGYISRFRKLLQTLLEDSYSKSNNFSDPPPDVGEVEWMGQEYLPILAESPPNELLEEVLAVFESVSSDVWRQIWDATPAVAQIKILQALMFTITPGELRSLSEIKT